MTDEVVVSPEPEEIKPVEEVKAKKVRKPKEEPVEDTTPVNPRVKLLQSLEKKYGKVCFDEKHILDNRKTLMPTTPTLDIALGGGLPEGSWTLISGKPKTGKTTLALQVAANAQKLGRHVYYLDIEHRFSEKNLSTISDLDTTEEKFTLVESTKERQLSAEDFLDIASEIIESHPGSVLIIDSVSCLCSGKEKSRVIGDSGRPEGPKLFAQFCRQNASAIPLNNITLIAMLHLIANTSGYGPSVYEDGGNKLQYQADAKLRIKATEGWDRGTGDNAKRIGSIVTWEVMYSPNGAPGGSASTYLRYGHGYDSVWEIINLACDYGFILKGGAWYTYTNDAGETIKEQGQEKLYRYFLNNPDECTKLHNKIKELVYEGDGD